MENEELSKLVWNTHSCCPICHCPKVLSQVHITYPISPIWKSCESQLNPSSGQSHLITWWTSPPEQCKCCGPTPTNATAYRSFYVHGDPKQSSIEIGLHWITDSLYTLSLWKSYMSYKATNSSWSKYEQTKSKRIYVHRVVATSQTM